MKIPRTLIIATLFGAAAPASPLLGARLTPVAGGFSDITTVTAPRGDGRVFVVEQRGIVRVIPAGQTTPLATPYLDLRDRVKSGGEQGLLGLAFHPRFAINGKLYVNYTNALGSTVIAEFRAPTASANRVSRATFRRLMRIAQPYSNHNGGNVAFGPDGFLYIGMGDGGSGGDPQNRAQSMRSRLGKMLRIDVNGTQGTLPYRIPATNPYRTRTGVPKEIYSIGLRNPWRFSFDRARGDLWIGDVGQNAVEEINFNASGLGRGVNYGWRRFEGRTRYSSTPLGPGRLIWPVATYSHSVGCSVTGGFVYRGPSIPGLDGRYLYSDFCASKIWSLRAGPTPGDRRDITASLGVTIPKYGVRTFGEGGDGTLYIANATQVWRFRG